MGIKPTGFSKLRPLDDGTSDFNKLRPDLRYTIKEALMLGSLCILPPCCDGSKRPFPPGWKDFQDQKPTKEQLIEWYDSGLTGFGLVCGAISDNLECMDFDDKKIFGPFCTRMKESGLSDLLKRLRNGYMERTPNGYHFLYRCEEIAGSTKLAKRPKLPDEMKDEKDKTKILIETRGEGGFIVCAPSHGRVNSAGEYKLSRGSLSTIPTITPSEREDLFNVARTFQVDSEEVRNSEQKRLCEETSKLAGRPGDDFNKQARWADILEPHGWKFVRDRGGVLGLRRPGKDEGISATLNYQGNDLFHCFTSSTEFEQRSYDKFGVYAVLNHGGDYSTAAKQLRSEGHGGSGNAGKSVHEGDIIANNRGLQQFPEIEFPLEALPRHFIEVVTIFVKAYKCPPAFMAMNFLTVISGAVGNAVILELKRAWTATPFFWFYVVAPSGDGKSPSINAAIGPIHRRQALESVRHKGEMQLYSEELAAFKKGNNEGEPLKERQKMRQYYTSNFTIEALLPMYQVNSRGLIIHVDELAGLFTSMNQYKAGRGSDNEQMLSLFDCGPLKSDRKNVSDSCNESGAAIIGGIQPKRLPDVFNDRLHDNGMVYRFLPMILNMSPARYTDDDISEEDEGKWFKLIDWMYNISAPIDPKTGFIIKNRLSVDNIGKAIWVEFYNEISALQPFMPERFRGYIPKLITYSLKFMAVLHLLKCHKKDELTTTVTKSTVTGAIKLTHYFAGQAMKLVADSSAEQDPYNAVFRTALISLKDEVKGGKLFLKRIREKVNELLPPPMVLDGKDKRLGAWLRKQGLQVKESTGNRAAVFWDDDVILG